MGAMNRALTTLDDCVAFYEEDPVGRRGITPTGMKVFTTAYYDNPDGDGDCDDPLNCEVGRRFKDPLRVMGQYGNSVDTVRGRCDTEDEFQELFMPQYQGLSMQFWLQLQYFHDDDSCWDENGLTEAGRVRAEKIRSWIRSNPIAITAGGRLAYLRRCAKALLEITTSTSAPVSAEVVQLPVNKPQPEVAEASSAITAKAA